MTKTKQNKSVYGSNPKQDEKELHILAILVNNEPGVLARVIGLFSARGYNIESLTVAETNVEKHLSRITIVSCGTPDVIEQIKAQLGRLVPVLKISDLTTECPYIERELALVKVACTGDKRIESLQIANIFRARVVDSTHKSFIFEITGGMQKVSAFIDLMNPLGLSGVSRTGIAAISRGPQPIGEPCTEE
ncbi:MAG: acetolactate synthase small subunit [Alphaproteobacteria bacterium]|nr:acetolactate synthase small subunit [Alphaproteobacteria bacterium]